MHASATLLAVFLGLVLSAGLARLLINLAPRLGFLDHPGTRKLQSQAVPLLGGVALYAAVLIGMLVLLTVVGADGGAPGGWRSPRSFLWRWLLGGFWLLIVGIRDDRRDMSATGRFLAQMLTLVLLVPELWGWMQPAWLGLLIGALWVLGLVNAFNFLDNMDAAAASTGFWTALALSLPLLWAGEGLSAAALWTVAAALLGFLWWNRPPARLYMGDAGSTWLGFTLAAFTLAGVTRADLNPWLAPLFLALPIYDTATVFWIRWREGRPVWIGDRRHVTHRMADRGAGVPRVILVMNAWTLLAAALALILHRRGGVAATALAAVFVLALLLFNWERSRERRRNTARLPAD